MTADAGVLTFVLAVGLLTVTPGVDTALILRTAAVGEVRRAWGVVLGIQTGTLLWGVLASAGLAALVTASPVAYAVLRWAGAGYLLWVGLGMIRSSLRRPRDDAAEPPAVPGGLAAGWRRGALTNLLNPKMGAFYVALLPQFIPADAPHLAWGVLLASVHVLLGVTWSALLVVFARGMRGVLQRPAAKQVLDRVTGTVVAGLGVRLALGD